MNEKNLPVMCRFVSVLAVAFCVLAGCSGSNDRQGIEGTVTFNGRPLEEGVINFIPLSGTESPTAGAEIANGKFSVPSHKGAFTGKFRVEITAFQNSGKTLIDPRTGGPISEYEQFIPKEYNRESELVVEVTANAAKPLELFLASE